MKSIYTLFFSFTFLLSVNAQSWQSDLVKINTSTGDLTYNEDPTTGTKIPDFSRAGYKGGGIALPDVSVKKTISPIAGDNTAHVQSAINEVSALTPDQNGFRGTVLLEPGEYEISGTITINTSGVVLRGSGDEEDPANNTILNATGNTPSNRTVIVLGGGSKTNFQDQVSGTKTNITTDLVKVGDKSFEVEDASNLHSGDNIIIYHPCTEAWLNEIDFGGTDDDSGWEVNDQPIIFNTRIERIECNKIFINSPVFNDLNKNLSQSYIYKYQRTGLEQNIGLENLRVDIEYAEPNLVDNDHAESAVNLIQVENAWVDNCTFLHFSYAGVDTYTANYVTVSNTESIEPISPIDGGFRYNFAVGKASQNILFTNCKANNGRHAYVSNGTSWVAGIVFHKCESEDPFTSSEGHRRWTTGMLYDNFRDKGIAPSGDRRVLAFYNRGDYGTAHGWSSVNNVAWNCDARRSENDGLILIQRPPIGQNFAIGCKGVINGNGPFNHPTGYIEGSNNSETLVPASLYEAQLNARKDLDPFDEIFEVTSCEPYEWIDGITYNTSNNTAKFTETFSPTCTVTSELKLTIPELTTEITTSPTSLIAIEDDADYLWERCDGTPISNNMQQEFLVTTDAGYYLTVSKDGCLKTSNCYTGIVGLNNDEANTIAIFPNPSSGNFTLELNKKDDGSSLFIYDYLGNIVYQLKNIHTNQLNFKLDSPGTYLGELKNKEGKIKTFKLSVN